MNIVLTIVVAVFVFGIVIFVHELGHFLTAKRAGIKVNEFAIGMGPTLVKFVRGETKYAIRLLPIGGFVSMEGEDEESEDNRGFQNASIPRRMAVMVAGAFMNIVLGFLVCLIYAAFADGTALPLWLGVVLAVLGGLAIALIVLAVLKKYSIGKTVLGVVALGVAALLLSASFGGKGMFSSFTIARIDAENSPFVVGDKILKVNGKRMFVTGEIFYELSRTENGKISFEVLRDGQKVRLENLSFDVITATDENGEVIMGNDGNPYTYLDLGFKVYGVEKNFGSVMSEAFRTTLYYTRAIYTTLFDLITGRAAINQLSGPVGIVSEIGKAASVGWQPVVQMLALISVNLGVVNMLPLPALDGGKVLLLLLEAIRRKPLNKKIEIGINVVGFGLLMLLMVFVSFNDVRRIFF